ncbi:hypothetical protein [Halalkalibacillus halophilus]|uniref:hypothetical protein n=1 Tax=Halalkalibacillus halophilus TaxID=392827 RepID=UPI000428DA11|nr:hypothetical protein [Halalkalibacillus halophilus]
MISKMMKYVLLVILIASSLLINNYETVFDHPISGLSETVDETGFLTVLPAIELDDTGKTIKSTSSIFHQLTLIIIFTTTALIIPPWYFRWKRLLLNPQYFGADLMNFQPLFKPI